MVRPQESNPRPPALQSSALPTELILPHYTRENTFHSNWCHPLKIKVILDSKTQDSGFQEQKFPAFPYWGGDFRGPLGQAFPLSTLACLRARRVNLRHHFIKNAVLVSCLHNKIFRETTLVLKIYQYIKKIYPIVINSKHLLRKHNRFHVTVAILNPSDQISKRYRGLVSLCRV